MTCCCRQNLLQSNRPERHPLRWPPNRADHNKTIRFKSEEERSLILIRCELQLITVGVPFPDPQPHYATIHMESNMKRLIVLSLSATLLALSSGCSILSPQLTEPCDAPTPLRSRLGQLRLKNLLPWRSSSSDECLECNEGFSEVGYSDGQMIDGQFIDGQVIDGGYVDGQVIDGGYVDGGYTSGSSYPVQSESLYHPDVVFEAPIVEAPSIPLKPMSQSEEITTPTPYR